MSQRPARVLVIDDNLEMAQMLADGLTDKGFTGVAEASGQKAIGRIIDEDFDVILTDLRLPDSDGLEVLAASKKQRPERPVFIMTAYGAVDTAVEAIRQGAYHYFTKPFRRRGHQDAREMAEPAGRGRP
jgi:two-component system response regulator HydG